MQEKEKPVVDIMTALKQSIEHAKLQKKPMEKARGKKKVVVLIDHRRSLSIKGQKT